MDSLGGTEPVISTAMFNLQSDQSRGTPRKHAPAARLELSAARHGQLHFIRFSRAEAQTHGRWGERRNTAEGESAAGNTAPRTSQSCTNSQPGACSTLFASQRLSQPVSDVQLKPSPLCIWRSAALLCTDETSQTVTGNQPQFVCLCDDAHEQTQMQLQQSA